MYKKQFIFHNFIEIFHVDRRNSFFFYISIETFLVIYTE